MNGKEKLALLLENNHKERKTFGDTAAMVSISKERMALILQDLAPITPRLERRLDILLG